LARTKSWLTGMGRSRASFRARTQSASPGRAVRTVIRAVKAANQAQVHMWECVLLTSGAAPLSAAGPLRWIPSVDGDRLVGSHLSAEDQRETGR
jgi:hypothetical protein